MRNAALMLGVIGGLWGMVVGFFGYGYIEVLALLEQVPDIAPRVEHVERVRAVSLLAPLLAIAGGAMARAQAQLGGVLMLLSAAGMYWAFGFGVFTMFPIAFCGIGGLLALAARQPDTA
ncbi:MAG: hypothetical protein ACE368_02080 [Paracoccaceae bacterium]